VSTITREAEAVEAPEEPPVTGAPEPVGARACESCGAALASDQDWCLECGTAQPDRPGVRPTWRTAAAVLVTTGVLAAGAVAAASAGLSADAKQAAAPSAQAALPAAPPPAAATPPAPAAPPAQTTPPAAATPAPKPSPATPPAAKTPAPTPPAPTPPAASAPKPTTTQKKPAAEKPKTPSPGPLAAIALKPEAAAVYNPYARPETDFTDPKLALDGDKATAWTASFSGDDTLLGVVLDLGRSKGARALQLVTSTPGMTVEIYAARGAQPPVSVQDPGWDHVATQLDVADDGRIRLGDGTKKYRWILVWPTEGPADGGTQVAVSELKVYE
jgi:hypothetical protein